MSNESTESTESIENSPISKAIDSILATSNVPKLAVSISVEDLQAINNAKNKVQAEVAKAEKLAAEAKLANAHAHIADLEYRTLIQHIFIRYGMSVTDRIDDATGAIQRQEESTNESE